MVSESSTQISMSAPPVSLQIVFFMFWSIRMRVERRRRPQTQTSSLPAVFQLVSLLPQALPASLLLSVSLPEPQAAGDQFVAPAFTPFGTPYPSALKFLRQISHSGDKLDAAAGRDAPRFHHECTASTFMTPTHVAYMVHACSAAVARATAKAARRYAHSRAISHSVRENTLARPAVVQPTF